VFRLLFFLSKIIFTPTIERVNMSNYDEHLLAFRIPITE